MNAVDRREEPAWSFFLGTLYRRVTEVSLVFAPMWIFLYLHTNALPFVSGRYPAVHFLSAMLTSVAGLGAAYVGWRGYQVSGEAFLRWMVLGFFGAGFSDMCHGLGEVVFPSATDHFVLLGIFSRLQLALAILLGILRFETRVEHPSARAASGFWYRVVAIVVLANLGIVGLGLVSATVGVSFAMVLNAGVALVALAGIGAAAILRVDTPVMNALLVTLAMLAQTAVPYYFSQRWDSNWWLAHAIYGIAYLVLGYGLIRGYLTTRSLTAVYTGEATIRRLILARDEAERRAGRLLAQMGGSAGEPENAIPGTTSWRRLIARADAELARSQVTHEPLSITWLAIADWETLRNQHEQTATDSLRASFVASIATVLRPLDVMTVDGRDRFIVLMPTTDGVGARRVAERLCAGILANSLAATTFALRLRCCAGIAQFGTDGATLDEIIAVAGKRLDIALDEDGPDIVAPRNA